MVQKSMNLLILLFSLILLKIDTLLSKINTYIFSKTNIGVAKMNLPLSLLYKLHNSSKTNLSILNQFEVVYYFTRWQKSGKK